MEEKPRVVISTSRKRESGEKFFPLSSDQILPGGLFDFRMEAWEAYSHIPVPNPTEESWRRSDIHSLPVASLRLPDKDAPGKASEIPPKLNKPLLSSEVGGRVFVTPGSSSVFLSKELQKQGVLFTDLRTAEKEHRDILYQIAGQIVPVDEGKFAALTAAFSRNGILLYVPSNVKVLAPLNGILWGSDPGTMLISHVMVWLEAGSSASFVLESASPNHINENMHASNIEVLIGEEASLQFIDLQSLGENTWNFSHSRARVMQNANIDWIYGAVGSKFTKSFIDLDLAGTGAKGRMSGFYFTDGTQHLDLDTQQDHHAAHTTSDLLFKGALKGNSRTVWQGMIYVAPEAQRADGYQANRNIVLSNGARADSIPGLEILADDVRCTHGATVSRLEDEPKFYLQSRGIPKGEAEQLLVEGFFEPIMDRIPFPVVRRRFSQDIHNKMKKE